MKVTIRFDSGMENTCDVPDDEIGHLLLITTNSPLMMSYPLAVTSENTCMCEIVAGMIDKHDNTMRQKAKMDLVNLYKTEGIDEHNPDDTATDRSS